MSDSPSGDLRETASADGPGILAGLPRTRPQRASARRTAARAAKPGKRAAKPGKGAAKPGKRPLTHANRSAPAGESVPMQGYEPEGDSQRRPIQPPGGAELVASIAELAGELAKAGVNTGGRVLKDFLSRMPN
jgi:hypothetical protein